MWCMYMKKMLTYVVIVMCKIQNSSMESYIYDTTLSRSSCYQNNVHRLSPTFCKAAASAHVRHPFEVARASAKTEA